MAKKIRVLPHITDIPELYRLVRKEGVLQYILAIAFFPIVLLMTGIWTVLGGDITID